MPTLDWIGKSKVVNHHLDVPYCVLDRKYSFDEKGQHEEDNGSENMIIHGDNLLALKSLLPQYEGRIKCIYIDPPYNTGNEGWIYNDNVNDPHIKDWLNKVVGKEGEDLSRHDKWLCMMYPRLKLLQRLLAEDGCLVISISYHELHNLVNLLREIFGINQIVTVTVQTSGGKPSGGFNYVQEYLVFVVPTDFHANALDFCGGNNRTPFEGFTLSTFDKTQRPNQTYPIFIDENGGFVGVGKSLQEQIDEGSYTGEKADFPYDYSIAPQGTVAVWPITAKGKQCVWRQIPGRLQADWKKGYIKISKNKSGNNENQYSVQYLPSGVIKKIKDGELDVLGHEDSVPTLLFGENQTVGGQVPTIWTEKAFFTVNGTQTLKDIFPESPKTFDYPKSIALIEGVVRAITKDGDIILDSFAGSGTTAHAVLNMNKADGGRRKFILVEMGDYADNITAERVKRVIKGYDSEDDKEELVYNEELKPSNLNNAPQMLADAKTARQVAKDSGEYDSVGNPKIVDNHLQVVGKIKTTDTIVGTGGSFSYYELGEPVFDGDLLNESVGTDEIRKYVYFTETKQHLEPFRVEEPYYMGTHMDVAYYFNYEKETVTTLNRDFLHMVKTRADGYVIYADLCTLSQRELEKWHITFKKIPRDISRL